jgi:hypothetical protein
MRVQIEVEFKDYASMMKWSVNSLKLGTSLVIDVESGLRIQCAPLVERRAFPGGEAILTILVDVASDVARGLLASWIYDKFIHTQTKVKIGRNKINKIENVESIRNAIDSEILKKE